MESLQDYDFKALAKKQKSIQMKMRYLALWHFSNGMSRTQIAKSLGVSRTSVNLWVKIFLNEGIDALQHKPRGGKASYLSEAQKEQLKQFILDNSVKPNGGRLVGEDIRLYIQTQFSCTYHLDSVYVLLKKLGFSWVTSRSKHPKQSKEAQEAFKKIRN